ncbi:hypothetical protein JW796_04405 [Candidatus Dojkabacteria bacterium]|nr:hypothetical protein [Candidatus Dojkabacteria bacterium]
MDYKKHNEITSFLEKLRFSHNEIRLYLKLIEIGSSNITDLSRYLKTPRTSIHRYSEKLIQKGFVSQALKGKQRELIPEKPERLRKILDDEQLDLEINLKKIQELQNGLPGIIKTINTSIPSAKENARIDVKYYEGKNGAKYIYQQAFRAKELRSYVNLSEAHRVFPGNTELYTRIQRENRNPHVREIIDNSKTSIKKAIAFSHTTNFEFKISPIHLSMETIDILIFDNKVAMVNFKDPVVGSILTNKDNYETTASLFDFVWDNSPNYQS